MYKLILIFIAIGFSEVGIGGIIAYFITKHTENTPYDIEHWRNFWHKKLF